MSTTDGPGESSTSTKSADAPVARLPKGGDNGRTAAPAPRPSSERTRTVEQRPKAAGARPQARPAAARGARPAPRRPGRATPRRVRLTLSRVDPWSVMKIAFLLSVALGIAMVVMMAVLWTVLAGMGVFSSLNDLLRTLDRSGSNFNLMDYIGFGRVVSLSVVIAVIDIVLMTALATLAAFLYNICSSLVGGVQMTLSDE